MTMTATTLPFGHVGTDLGRHLAARRRRLRLVMLGLVVALVAVAVAAIGLGAHTVAPARVIAVIEAWARGTAIVDRDHLVVVGVRLPRVLLALLVGATLAVAGAVMQGLFRNPLADPGIVGVSSGAALAAACAIVVGDRLIAAVGRPLPFDLLPVAAFGGALVGMMLLGWVGRRAGQTRMATVLLAGLAFAALANAGIGLLVAIADDRQLRDLSFWSLGSFGGSTWSRLGQAAPFLLLSLALAAPLGRALDALAIGEAEAFHMGIPVETVKRIAFVAVALGVGASVAAVGAVGFVGMVVPHVARLALGPAHRPLLLASALGGAVLVVLADLVARTVTAPAELPIGILTALLGAPVFLHLVAMNRGEAPR